MWRHDNHIELLLFSNLVRASCLQGYLLLTVDRLLRNACMIKLFSICGLTMRLYVPSATVCSTAPKHKTNLKITCPRSIMWAVGEILCVCLFTCLTVGAPDLHFESV